MKLTEILQEFNLGRETFNDIGTDKNTIHSYVDGFYEEQFSFFKNQNISLLEIGIEFGASLKLWSEYFTNATEIIGVDIADRVLPEYKNLNNVSIIFKDAYDINISNSLPNFDIIIDDGPHTLESQLITLENYLPKLKKGGLLVIEDIQSEEYFHSLEKKFNEVCELNQFENLSFELVDLRNLRGRYDDLMFVVRA